MEMNLILGYSFTAINYVCYCASRFVKEKYQMLLLDIVAKIFTIAGLYMLGSLSGSYSFMVTLVLLFVATVKERKGKKWLPVYILFQIIYTAIMVMTFAGISSVLVFLNMTVNLICIWHLRPQQMRFVGACNCLIYFSYQMSIRNWAGLLELVVLASNVVSFCSYRKRAESD